MRGRAWLISLVVLCLCPKISQAGLVFEIHDIDGHHIDAAVMKTDRLEIRSQGRNHVFQFPAGVGALLIDWVRRDSGGPLVFSIDSSLVLTDGHTYWPPSVPDELARLLLRYDDHAHQIACGATPEGKEHPLVRRAGEHMLPHRVHQSLLDPATQNPQAYAYRRLPERFVKPPGCVGELTLHASPGTGGKLVDLRPRSWVSMITRQWYRLTDVPSASDEWVASLPYQPLRQDLEQHWPEYRTAFSPMASLSSIVEAMAMLRGIKRDAPTVWRYLEGNAPVHQHVIEDQIKWLSFHKMDTQPWSELSYTWIGQIIETPAEANLAIGLALTFDPNLLTTDGLQEVARRDRTTAAKLEIARMLLDSNTLSDSTIFTDRSKRLFHVVSQAPQGFRLGVMALLWMSKIARATMPQNRDIAQLIDERARALQDDFVRRAESACASGSTDLVSWESLIQDVYSVGLLRQLAQNDILPQRIVTSVACAHFHRGMALQRGAELAYRHAHYRFLRYLSRYANNSRTQEQISQYRKGLAQTMNLRDWADDVRELL